VYMWGDPYKGQLGHYGKNEGWSHAEKHLQTLPLKLDLSFLNPNDRVKKVVMGGIHSAFLSDQGLVYTFGCGSDGRLGHPEYEGHVYLYKESRPKQVNLLKDWRIVDLQSSYYHMVALGEK
jgi:regulator of chromosome condensation